MSTAAGTDEGSWKNGFKQALFGFIIDRGGLVQEDGGDIYGWREYGHDEASGNGEPAAVVHMRGCSADLAASQYEDSRWNQFDGTLAEPPVSTHTGIDAVITCACGQVRNRTWRYTGGYADLIRAITDGS